MNDILKTIGKFWFPAACILVSLILLKVGFTGDPSMRQNDLAFMGLIALLVIGVVSLLFLLDIFKSGIVWVLGILFLGGAAYFGFQNYKTISDELALTRERALIKAKMIQRLKDVRTAEIAYLDAHGVYTKDWNELKNFVKNGKVQIIRQVGELPDTISVTKGHELGLFVGRPEGMTDQEIINQKLVVLDTLYQNALQSLFENEKAMEDRKFPLNLDQFEIAPGSKDKLILNAGIIDVSGGVKQPVFACTDPNKDVPEGEEPLQVGSMLDAITNGNWKE